MPRKVRNLAIQAVLIGFAAAALLQGCQQESTSVEAEPEEIIGQVDLPGQEGAENGKSEQDQASDSSLPPVPDKIHTKLPDFSQFKDVEKKKKAFFDFLRPIARAENRKVLKERAYVLSQWQDLQQGKALSGKDQEKLSSLAQKYRVDAKHTEGRDFFKKMLMRIDKIPVSLALIQAAKESGWGTSYFARKGNNLFGQWCFKKGCGLVPRQRPAGARYEVKKFKDVSESVQAYIQNLNSHPAYQELRQQRYQMRLAGKEPDAQLMAEGLGKYSQIGRKYVNTVQKMIRGNEKFMGLHDTDAES
jgi:Bax protein